MGGACFAEAERSECDRGQNGMAKNHAKSNLRGGGREKKVSKTKPKLRWRRKVAKTQNNQARNVVRYVDSKPSAARKSFKNEAKVKLGKFWKDWGQSRSASENGGQARPLNTGGYSSS